MSVVVVVVEEALDIKLRTSPTKACIKEQCQMGTDESSQVTYAGCGTLRLVCGANSRYGFIRFQLESRLINTTFNTKSDYRVM